MAARRRGGRRIHRGAARHARLHHLVAARLSPDEAEARGIRAEVSGRADPAVLKDIAALVEAGKLKPVVGRVFLLAQAADAQRLSETGHGRGRIILKIAD